MVKIVYDGSKFITVDKLYEHDYGQKLQLFGLELPSVVEAHFSRKGCDESVLSAGTCSDGVTVVPIPDGMLEDPGVVAVYIYERGDSAGETLYKIEIRVERRPELPTSTTSPTDDDKDYFGQVIEAVTEQTDRILNGLSVGDVATLEAGAEATASIAKDASGEALVLNLGIPKGDTGSGGTEGFGVVFTLTPNDNNGYDVTSDHTISEVREAISAGKWVYGISRQLNSEGEVISECFMPLMFDSGVINFGWAGTMVINPNAVDYGNSWMMHTDVIAMNPYGGEETYLVIYGDTAPATLTDYAALEQRVAALEAAING